MKNDITGTIKKKSLDGVFNELNHSEVLGISNNEQLCLFHLKVRGKKFYTDDLQTALYRNIGKYVFSRAALEDFHINGDEDTIISQALKVMNENGAADTKGTGNELGEMLVYTLLEEKLDAPKILSRVEIATDAVTYASECESIHLLTLGDSNSGLTYEMVFGASDTVGDIKDAIDHAFEAIDRIEQRSSKEIKMVEKTALNRFYNPHEIDFIKQLIIPQPRNSGIYEIAYGVFLGYTLGIDPTGYTNDQYAEMMEKRLALDITHHTDYIAQKIKDYNLDGHSFYFYILPFDNAEDNKKEIMTNVMKGDVTLWIII